MKKYDIEFAMRRLISTEARAYVVNGGKINRLAAKSGLCHGTVARLVYGETVYPRLNTVVSVLAALGYTVDFRKGEAKEVDAAETAGSPENVHTLPSGGEKRKLRANARKTGNSPSRK